MRERTNELLDAANKLLPMLKSIPKAVVYRHPLIFENIVWDMIDEYNAQDPDSDEIVEIEFIMAINLPYYIQYGKSLKTIRDEQEARLQSTERPKSNTDIR